MSFLEKLTNKNLAKSVDNKKAFDFLEQSQDGYTKWFENDFDKPSISVKQQVIDYIKKFGIEKSGKNFPIVPELKEAIASYFKKCQIKCEAKHVVIRATIFDFLGDLYKAIEMESDEKILFTLPISGYFIQQCNDHGIGTEFLNTDSRNGWKIDFIHLTEVLQKNKIRILFFNYPNSTSNAILSSEEISALVKIARDFPDLLIVTDESARDLFVSQNAEIISLASAIDLADRVITMSNLKSRGLGDLDVSFSCLQDKLILARLFREEINVPNSNQHLAISALKDDEYNQKHLEDIINQCQQNAALVAEELKNINANLGEKFGRKEDFVKAILGDLSTNSMLLQFDSLKGSKTEFGNKTLETDLDVAEFLKDKAGIVMIPGQCQLLPEEEMILKLYILKSKQELKEGFKKINQALLQLKMLKKEISALKYNSGSKGGSSR